MNISISLIRKFFIFSLSAFVLIWFFLSLLTTYQIEQFTLKKTQTEISGYIKKYSKDYFLVEGFEKSNYQKNKPLFDKFFKDINYLGVARVKVYDQGGFIIYSDESSLFGKSFENDDLAKALEGEDVAEIENPLGEEQATERSLGKFIEAYIPIFFDQQTKPSGVIEVYIPLSPIYQSLYPFKKVIWGLTALVFTIFFYILYIIFRKASDTILEKNRELEEKSGALKLSTEQDEAILESIDEGLVMVNKAGQVLTFNPKAESLTGYNSYDIAFRHYKSVLDFRDKEGKKLDEDFLKNALDKKLLVRKDKEEEIFLRNMKKELIPISLVTAPIYDNKLENIVGAIATFDDISKEKELDKVRDEFVYVIAHELSNPIFVVSSYLSMILEGNMGKINDKVKEALNFSKDANQQLSNLVTDLLEVIRSQTGQMKFDLTPVDIDSVAEETIKGLQGKARDKKIDILFDKKQADKVISNPLKLKEVFINLIDNAIKYSPEGSKIKVWFEKEGNNLKSYVKDNGFGMTKIEASKLFDKFYRIQNDKTKGISGTGLGLFIVKQLVEKMGGNISFETEEGKGTIFIFSLKCESAK